MAATSLPVWADLEYNIHHHGCWSVAGVEAWYVEVRLYRASPHTNQLQPLPYSEHFVHNRRWLGSTAGRAGSLGVPAYLQPVLEPSVLFEARYGSGARRHWGFVGPDCCPYWGLLPH